MYVQHAQLASSKQEHRFIGLKEKKSHTPQEPHI